VAWGKGKFKGGNYLIEACNVPSLQILKIKNQHKCTGSKTICPF
jgi:hypothetical protein